MPVFLASSQLVGESVINIAVMALIFTDHDDHISQPRIRDQFPIVNRNFRRRDIGYYSTVDIIEVLCIAVDCFLFEIAHNAVSRSGVSDS